MKTNKNNVRRPLVKELIDKGSISPSKAKMLVTEVIEPYYELKNKHAPIMKTNKEIEPFKMRCNLNESKIAMSVLRKSGYETKYTPTQDSNKLFIVLYNCGKWSCLRDCGIFESAGDSECPELTCSEFMKLYGDEEEEVFTREDMIMFAYGTLCSLSHSSTEEDVEHLLTTYLSTRTND